MSFLRLRKMLCAWKNPNDDEATSDQSKDDINILLLGHAGVGKATFINTFVNYLPSDSLEDAMNKPLQVVMPTSFTYIDPKSFEEKTILIGQSDDHEKATSKSKGDPCIHTCRTFVFPINGRKLRFIDAPGVGDPKGISQDKTNFEDMLASIKRYGHLNGICLVTSEIDKPFTHLFRFHVQRILKSFHINARENLIFIFTNAGRTSSPPPESTRLVDALLDDMTKNNSLKISFDHQNIFSFDIEPFRCLVLHKNGISCSAEEYNKASNNWARGLLETRRLLEKIFTCPKHDVYDTVMLNHIQQIIRILSRPIGQVVRLIEENKKLVTTPMIDGQYDATHQSNKISQLDICVLPLEHPCTVCVNRMHVEVINDNGINRMNYLSQCHPRCYTTCAEEEIIGDERLKNCSVMDPKTGLCRVCNFSWGEHMCISYEIKKIPIEIDLNVPKYAGLSAKEKREKLIEELEMEKNEMLNVCAQLLSFSRRNSFDPVDDSMLYYLDLAINETQQSKALALTAEEKLFKEQLICGLRHFKNEYVAQCKYVYDAVGQNSAFTSIIDDNGRDNATPESLLELVRSLYNLPINGQRILGHMKQLDHFQRRSARNRDKIFNFSAQSHGSKILKDLF